MNASKSMAMSAGKMAGLLVAEMDWRVTAVGEVAASIVPSVIWLQSNVESTPAKVTVQPAVFTELPLAMMEKSPLTVGRFCKSPRFEKSGYN